MRNKVFIHNMNKTQISSKEECSFVNNKKIRFTKLTLQNANFYKIDIVFDYPQFAHICS